jgi:uncharacterized membrane protein
MEAFPPPVIPYLPLVITHITAGSIAIIAGYMAVSVRKGERLHRAVGTVFVLAMLVMASVATYLAISLLGQLPGQTANIAAGTLVAYLVGTAWVAARRKGGAVGSFEKFALAVALGSSATFVYWGVVATTSSTGKFDGYPPYLYFVFAGIIALFAAMDIKVILRGSLTGPQRIARHLSRMCFAFFVAAGSFFLGQQKVMPDWMRGAWYLYVLGLAPLGFMIFWLIRVRLTNWYKRDTTPALADKPA